MPDVPWEPHWEPTQSECPTLALDRALLQGLSSVPGPLSTRPLCQASAVHTDGSPDHGHL